MIAAIKTFMQRAALSEAVVSTLVRDGACRLRSALSAHEMQDIEAAVADLPADQAGTRLHGVAKLNRHLLPAGALGAISSRVLSENCQAVRAILFNKSASTNWSLAWHQDRTLAVAERVHVDGFGPWSRKRGMLHVAPPFEILAKMVTLRLHLDPVPMTNAPLLIAPGSHRLGLIPDCEVQDIVARCGTAACLAERGDVWMYATPILHASERSLEPSQRRVLQVDYADFELPGGLSWLGV